MAVTWSIVDGNLPYLDDFPVQYDIEYTSDALWQINDGTDPYKKAFPINYGITDYPDLVWIIEDGDHPYKKTFPTMYPIVILEDQWLSEYNSVPYRLHFPSMNESSIDLWFINDSIPYKYFFPEMHETSLPDAWLSTGDVPFREDFPALHVSEALDDIWMSADDVPFRLMFPELKESANVGNSWVCDDDVPYRILFPELHRSEAFTDVWLSEDSVPFRVEFPDLKESLNYGGLWLIDDDIPFRGQYPQLRESKIKPFESWLQYAGYFPYRPWPGRVQIPNAAEVIEVPEIDWTKSMQQTFEYFTVDPKTWYDKDQLFTITSSNHTHDSTSDMRGSATLNTTENIPENYIRTYMVCKQGKFTYRECLGTYLYMTSSDNFNGMVHNRTMTGYTPLVELQESMPPVGYFIYGKSKRGEDAPYVTDEIRMAIENNTRCELSMNVSIQKPLLNNFVAGASDNWLTVVNNLLTASNEAKYMLTVDEWGTLQIRNSQSADAMQPKYVYDDGNSSILLADVDTTDDLFSIPNTVELIFTGSKNYKPCRVIVKNEDDLSPVSVQSRGREITRRFTITNLAVPNIVIVTDEMIRELVEAQAYVLLEALSTVNKTITYSHGYCGTKVGDCVIINYVRAGLENVKAVITSQKVNCTPGCQVDETAVYTKTYWRRK